MQIQCPNCGGFKTRISGGRGCLLDLGRAVGQPLILLGLLLVPINLAIIALQMAVSPLLASQGMLWPLLLIGTGLAPLWLARCGTRHGWRCHLCGFAWRQP
jgi:hypothetical protein